MKYEILITHHSKIMSFKNYERSYVLKFGLKFQGQGYNVKHGFK